MKVLGDLVLVGGAIRGAVLEVLSAAPAVEEAKQGQLFVSNLGLGFVDGAGVVEHVATASQVASINTALSGKLDLALGGTVEGAATFNGAATFVGAATRTSAVANANDLTNKAYVDNLFEFGIEWLDPVTAIVDVLPDTGLEVGQRFILTTDKKIYDVEDVEAVATMNAGTDAESGNSVFVDGSNAGYRFDGTEWTRFTGTGNQTAGAGLTITGSVLNVIGDSSMTITDDEIGVKVGNGLEVDETNGVQITDAFIASLLGLSGGTLTGALVLHAAPTEDMEAANKKYVDDAVSGITTVVKFAYVAEAAAQVHTVNHNLGTLDVAISVFDEDGEVVVPESIALTSANTVTVTVGADAILKVVVVG